LEKFKNEFAEYLEDVELQVFSIDKAEDKIKSYAILLH